jgi:hypothetical protein
MVEAEDLHELNPRIFVVSTIAYLALPLGLTQTVRAFAPPFTTRSSEVVLRNMSVLVRSPVPHSN